MFMIANASFRGEIATDPFHYIKFGLTRLKISRENGLPNAGTPVETQNNSGLYHITLTALGFKNGGNCIKLDNFDVHFQPTLDPKLSQEATKSLTLFRELAGAPVTLKFLIGTTLPEAIECYLIGEKFRHFFITALEMSAKIKFKKTTVID